MEQPNGTKCRYLAVIILWSMKLDALKSLIRMKRGIDKGATKYNESIAMRGNVRQLLVILQCISSYGILEFNAPRILRKGAVVLKAIPERISIFKVFMNIQECITLTCIIFCSRTKYCRYFVQSFGIIAQNRDIRILSQISLHQGQ